MSFNETPVTGAPEGKNAMLEAYIRRAAADFQYPATPDIATRERTRLGIHPSRRRIRFAYALALALIVLAVSMLVSPVRARVLDWIRIGAVRIFYTQPESTATPAPLPSATPLTSLMQVGGATTLEHAREQIRYTIMLPAYPEDLGEPNYVYIQRFSTPVVFLVWADDDQPGQVRLSLSQAESNLPVFEKYDPRMVEDTQVHGVPALWIEGDYVMVLRNGDFTMSRLITQGHVLVWTHEGMTFRLETDETLGEAIRIAESIR